MQIVTSQVLYEGKLRAVRDLVEAPNGRRFIHETIEHPGAVVILPIADDGRLVFVEQYRHSIRDLLLELPAGTLEKGEEPSECALRELSEEIGMTSDALVSLGELLPAPGFCNERQHLFCARSLRPKRGQPDEDEVIALVYLSKEEAFQAVRSGRLRDAKSISLLMRALLEGYLEPVSKISSAPVGDMRAATSSNVEEKSSVYRRGYTCGFFARFPRLANLATKLFMRPVL